MGWLLKHAPTLTHTHSLRKTLAPAQIDGVCIVKISGKSLLLKCFGEKSIWSEFITLKLWKHFRPKELWGKLRQIIIYFQPCGACRLFSGYVQSSTLDHSRYMSKLINLMAFQHKIENLYYSSYPYSSNDNFTHAE